MPAALTRRAQARSLHALKMSWDAWIIVVRLTIPALIVTRLLLWFDFIPYVALVFEPLMGLMGLPAEAALVWVTAMLTNLISGLFILITLLPVMGSLTVAQVTVLACVIAVAHNLIVEGQVCKGAGVSPLRVSLLRIGMAFLFGLTLHHLTGAAGWGEGEAVMLIQAASDPVPPWGAWLRESAENLLLILPIITALMFSLEILQWLGFTRLMMKLLGRPLKIAGIGEKAIMITIIGNVLGLGYGGGLIIAESRSGRIPDADVHGSVTFMAMCHSLVEDTLLMLAAGASLWGMVAGRLIFSLMVTGLVTRLARRPATRPVLIGKGYKI